MDSGGTHNYVTDGDAPAAPVLSDGSAVYTPGLSENRSGTSAFYHGDSIGSNRDITNSSQSVTDTRRYDAFGNLMQTSGSNPTPFGFAGSVQYQTDGDSGLKLLGHRYYDPTIGRFLSQNPVHAGTNWYAYCENGPLGATDASGLDPTGKPVGYENGTGSNGEAGQYPFYKDGSRGEFIPDKPVATDGPTGHGRGRNVKKRGGEEQCRAA